MRWILVGLLVVGSSILGGCAATESTEAPDAAQARTLPADAELPTFRELPPPSPANPGVAGGDRPSRLPPPPRFDPPEPTPAERRILTRDEPVDYDWLAFYEPPQTSPLIDHGSTAGSRPGIARAARSPAGVGAPAQPIGIGARAPLAGGIGPASRSIGVGGAHQGPGVGAAKRLAPGISHEPQRTVGVGPAPRR